MHWSPFKKFTFRWLSLYLFLFMMSNQFILAELFHYFWAWLTPLIGRSLFQITSPLNFDGSGSGDTTFYYLSLVAYLLVALILALVWTFFDRQRKDYNKLLEWLMVLLRYYVMIQMFIYGLAKIFYLQFQEPNFSRLLQPFGEASPMGLLWAFMGYSKGYTMFSGFGELIGGLLLVSRRTQLLGAFIVFGVMSNVLAMNLFYDVPVKILSAHLVLMSVLILAMDGKRILQFFILNQATTSANLQAHFKRPDLEKYKDYAKWGLVIVGLGVGSILLNSIKSQINGVATKIPLTGLYNVDQFILNQDTLAPLLTDTLRWRRLVVERPKTERTSFASIYFMNDTKKSYLINMDTAQNILTFKEKGDSVIIGSFAYQLPDTTSMHLTGRWAQDSIRVHFVVKRKSDFLLMRRKFHWINEFPFNR